MPRNSGEEFSTKGGSAADLPTLRAPANDPLWVGAPLPGSRKRFARKRPLARKRPGEVRPGSFNQS